MEQMVSLLLCLVFLILFPFNLLQCMFKGQGENVNLKVEGNWVGAYTLYECQFGYTGETTSLKSYCLSNQTWSEEPLNCSGK